MKLRACLLARVSTKNLSQESSIDNQIEQLSSLILSMDEFDFNPIEDVYYEQFTGTKIVRSTTQKGFNALMDKLGIEIVDTKNSDIIELSVKTKRNTKRQYDIIFCKSTSRFSRSSYKGESVIYLLKELGIDIYYFDLNKRLSQMSDEEIKLYSLIDNKYSKTVAFNHRNSFMIKNRNREILTRNQKFCYERIRKQDKKIYFIKKDEEVIIFNIMKQLFNSGKGCESIANYLNENGYTNNLGSKFSKSKVHNILKDPNYCGYEYFYNFENNREYLNLFGTDREYLKNIPKELDRCSYIEPIESLEEYQERMEEFKKRTIELNGKYGVKQSFSPISKICICGYCLQNGNGTHHYYSKGSNKNYKIGDRAFICTSKRFSKKYRKIDCKNKAFYETFFYEKMEKKTTTFKIDLLTIYDFSILSLENLKVHLLLLLDNNFDTSIIELKEEQAQLKDRLKELLVSSVKSNTSLDIIKEVQEEIDKRLLEIQNELFYINTLLAQIAMEIDVIDSLISTINEYKKDIDRPINVDEMLELIDHIIVIPKGKWQSNSVIFIPISKMEVEVNKLIEEVLNSNLVKLLDKDLINVKENPKTFRKTYLVKNPTQAQKERADILIKEV